MSRKSPMSVVARPFLAAAIGFCITFLVGGFPGSTQARNPDPATVLMKCVDCQMYGCHSAGFGYKVCYMSPEGCMAWDECG